MNVGVWLRQRITEPSTHATLTGALAVAAAAFPQYAAQLQTAAGVTAALGLGLSEKGGAGAGAPPTLPAAAWIPPVHIASNPYLAEAINVGIQAAITKLLQQPPTK